MTSVVIVDAVRTPIGRFRGALSTVRADHTGALVQVDDVIFGCVTQVGEQSGGIARTSLLSAGWPVTVPGLTIDRKCGSAEAAVHVATGLIASGACDIVAAGGAEAMSRVTMGLNRTVGGETYGWRLLDRFEMGSQGEASEKVADKWGLTRDNLDDFAMESHRRAAEASDAGRFANEIVPVNTADWRERDAEGEPVLMTADETIRRDTSREKLSTLKTSFRENGRSTAGNSSQISDGASALLLMSEEKAKELGLKPRARIVAMTSVGSDPTLMLTGPIAASQKVLKRAGLTFDDVELFEVNEAFAPVPLAWMAETGVGQDRLNVNGGAIALGHPLGASGARIMTTLLNEMERRGARYGLQAVCCAGGMATSTLLERIED
jgi:acetyl-CoA acetyltransferase family protein